MLFTVMATQCPLIAAVGINCEMLIAFWEGLKLKKHVVASARAQSALQDYSSFFTFSLLASRD